MLKAKLILPVEESDWVIPIVIKKDWKGICVCVDCMGLMQIAFMVPFLPLEVMKF